MEIIVKIKEISCSEGAYHKLSALGKQTAASKAEQLLALLPQELASKLLEMLAQENKGEQLAQLIREQEKEILQKLAAFLEKNGITPCIESVSMDETMQITVKIGKIDYGAMTAMFLPLLRKVELSDNHPAVAMLAVLLKLPGGMIRGAVDKLPQKKKDEAMVYFINKYGAKMTGKIESLAKKAGLHIRLDAITAKL